MGQRQDDRGATPVQISLGADNAVSGLLSVPEIPTACFVMAHGAGARMEYPFMVAVAVGVAERVLPPFVISFPLWSMALSARTGPTSRTPR
jgi:predicted alpha/beta-hydrolase family hydrolase